MQVVKMIVGAVFSVVVLVYLVFRKKRNADGTIVIDLYGDNEPIQLKLGIGLYELSKKKTIVLRVDDRTSTAKNLDFETFRKTTKPQ